LSREPSVLCSFARRHLAVIDGWDTDLAHHVRAATDPAALLAIEKPGRVAWLPLRDHVALTEALFVQAPGPARAICRKTVLESFQPPLLHPLLRGALALLGRSIERRARLAPAAWRALFRDAGKLSFQATGAGRGRIVLADATPAITDSPAYVEGLAGALSAFFEVARCEGEIAVRVEARRIDFALAWRPPAAPSR